MSKGKYAQRAESRAVESLEAQLEAARKELAEQKEWAHSVKNEMLRLKNLENIFDGTRDLIAELEETRKELRASQDKHFVLSTRLDRWAKIMVHEENREFMNLNKDVLADLVELGYYPEGIAKQRSVRRRLTTPKLAKRQFEIAKEADNAQV